MGRRALRKPSPDLDIQPYLLTADDLPDPWDDVALFGREAPLEIELGSGKGLFLQAATEAQPDTNFLGIEIGGKYARHIAGRLAKGERTNGLIMHGDGLPVFQERIPADHLTAVHVYFPDPWWKAKHRKRRVLNEPFLRNVQRTLKPGHSLHFWTDVQEYYETTLELIAECTDLEGPFTVEETPAEHTLDYRTHFERRTRLNDDPVYRSEFRKPAR